MIDYLNTLAAAWQPQLGWLLLQNTLFLGILYWLMHQTKISAGIRYLFGGIGLIKCLIPVAIPVPVLQQQIAAPAAAVADVGMSIESVQPTAAATLSIPALLVLLWALGAALHFGVWLFQSMRFHRRLHLQPLNTSYQSIPLFTSTRVQTPMNLGILRPRLVVPENWRQWPRRSRDMIMKHELAHIRRHDNLARALQMLVRSLYVFHPLVWLLSGKMDELREMACDDAATTGNATSIEYARALLHIAEQLLPEAAPESIHASALIRQKHELYNRITYQMEDVMKRQTQHRLLLLVLLLVAPFSVMLTEQTTAAPPDTAQTEFETFDTAPEPIGGFAAIQKNLLYPPSAQEAGIQGRVMVQVVIDKSGDVVAAEVVKSLNPEVDNAAVKAIEETKWKPATKDGNPVRVQVAVPVVFKLAEEKEEEKTPIHFAYDKAPAPIGGFAAIQKNLLYPQLAKQEKIEGRVVVQAVIDESGDVVSTEVIKSLRPDMDKAAVKAIEETKWDPALKDGEPVKVQVSMPVVFKLK